MRWWVPSRHVGDCTHPTESHHARLQVVPNLSHGARPWAVVENMVVDNRRRRQGIGRSLIGYALERSRQAGCYKVQLLSQKKRAEAHRFYRSMGFEESALGFRLYLWRTPAAKK